MVIMMINQFTSTTRKQKRMPFWLYKIHPDEPERHNCSARKKLRPAEQKEQLTIRFS